MEIVPKPPEEIPVSEKIFFYFSLFCLFFALFSFLFLFFSLKNLNSQKVQLEKRISEIKTPQIKEIERELSGLGKSFSYMRNLLESHFLISKLFPFLESKILKNVFLDSFSFNLSERKVEVSGIAESFEDLSKQYFVFKEDPKIEKLEILSVSLTPEGKISFKISFHFNVDIIKW